MYTFSHSKNCDSINKNIINHKLYFSFKNLHICKIFSKIFENTAIKITLLLCCFTTVVLSLLKLFTVTQNFNFDFRKEKNYILL